jgi:hypothetical protein
MYISLHTLRVGIQSKLHAVTTSCCIHTATYITASMCPEGATSYTEETLEALVEKLVQTKRRSHRPLSAVGGTRIQPAGDSSDDEGPAVEDLGENLDEL